MADKAVKSVTQLSDGNVIITYTDLSTVKKSALQATNEIAKAKLAGAYIQGNQNPGTGAAFGTSGTTGANTNSTTPVVTSENLTAYYQQALSSKNDGYAKIRQALLGANLITKGTRSLSSVQNAWLSVLQGASADGTDPYTYIANIKRQGVGLDQTGNEPPKPYTQVAPWDKGQAKENITAEFISTLHREPTAQELTDLTNKVIAAQKASPTKTIYTKDPKTGGTIATTIPSIDEKQFIKDAVMAIPGKEKGTTEYGKIKEAATTSALQSVQDAARANGIVLTPEDANAYAERVRNGEKIDAIASTFRKIAAISQPKAVQELLNAGTDLATIYQPYKAAMATTLELNPNDIQLTDPALSAAISGDKTMTTYEFQRALRKDDRWQYTNNARSEAANVATQVLKDFGFMG